MNCLFCEIVEGKVPSYKIYEDDLVYVFLDIHPTSAGDTLIIPKKHYVDIESLDEDVFNHIFHIGKKLALLYKEKLGIDGYSFCQNNGSCQEIKHFHLHLTPSYEKEKNLSLEEVYALLT